MPDNARKRLCKQLGLKKVDSDAEGKRKFQDQAGLYGFIDTKTGEISIKAQFTRATHFIRGFALVEKDGHQFSVNHNGDEVKSRPLPAYV
jgi:hypothetical protein